MYLEVTRIYICTNIFWIYWKICALPHTAALPDRCTLPRTLPESRTVPRILPHTVTCTDALLHTAALLESRTLLRALPDSHTLPRALLHTAACAAAHSRVYCRTLPHCCTLPHCRTLPHTAARTAAHCCTLPHTAWIKVPHTAHCTLHTAQSHTPELIWVRINVFECIYINKNYVSLCAFMCILMNQTNYIWMCMNLHEYRYDFIRFYFEFMQIYTNIFWMYFKICTLLDCRTLLQSCTLPHCRTLPHTAVCNPTHCCAHCYTLHESKCRTPHTAHCTLQTVAHRN
jgi:hypothetical protein